MADFLTTFTELLNKPEAAWGGRLVAGGVLATIVWKCFERVEAVLRDQTKFEIAAWLRGIGAEDKLEPPMRRILETLSKAMDKGLLPIEPGFLRACSHY